MDHTPLPMTWTLRCGTPLTLRAATPADGLALAAMLTSLSDRARRWRFNGVAKPASMAWIAQLTRPCTARQQALLVLTDDGHVVAEARWSRMLDDGVAAEFAIVVADEWQHRGIGRQLLRQLAAGAQRAGVRWLLGEVTHDNGPMCRLLQGLKVQHRATELDGEVSSVLRFELPVSHLLSPPARWHHRLMALLLPRRRPLPA